MGVGTAVPAEQVHGAYMAALHGSFARVVKADAWIGEQQAARREEIVR